MREGVAVRIRGVCCSVLVSIAAGALWLVLAAPASHAGRLELEQPPGVARGAYRGQCRRMDRQIARYTEQAYKAIDLQNDTMLESSYRRIGHLTTRRARLCPRYVDKRAGEELLKLLRLGGKVALKMFTWGMI